VWLAASTLCARQFVKKERPAGSWAREGRRTKFSSQEMGDIQACRGNRGWPINEPPVPPWWKNPEDHQIFILDGEKLRGGVCGSARSCPQKGYNGTRGFFPDACSPFSGCFGGGEKSSSWEQSSALSVGRKGNILWLKHARGAGRVQGTLKRGEESTLQSRAPILQVAREGPGWRQRP